MVNGKQKGNSFERKIANKLSDRFSTYTGIEKPFRRNPDSGSFFGGSNLNRKDVYDTEWAVYGDLICPKNFNFTIECKHYQKAPSLDSILKQSVKDWDLWISQAEQDSKACEKDYIIILKYNNTEIMAMVARDNYLGVFKHGPIMYYKDVEIHLLDTILQVDDPFFFEPWN